MAKSFLRERYASGSTRRLVEKIFRRGPRAVRRKFTAIDRHFLKGGDCDR